MSCTAQTTVALTSIDPVSPAAEQLPAAKETKSRTPSGKSPNKTALVLFRLFLALPGPMFLLFTGTQYSRRDQVAGWTGSFTKLYAGQILGILVWAASTAPLMISLLLAQIHDTDDANKQKDLAQINDTDHANKPKAHPERFWTWPRSKDLAHINDANKQKDHVWTWPRSLELALWLVSFYGYFTLYFLEQLDLYVFGLFFGSLCAVTLLYTFTIVVRSIKKYQEKYKSFVRSQAVRVGIITMIMACVATYALTAMLRVPIERKILSVFVELSLSGIACADQAAFVSAFEASAANASCPAVPHCGYATYEDLCQAVQYAPMVQALGGDIIDVNIFLGLSWFAISLVIFGTGRASADNGYEHLLSRHMLVAMVLFLVTLIMTLYSFLRLLIIVQRLSVPRPAAYFDRTDLMNKYELPLTCYGECAFILFYSRYVLYFLIALACNFDFFEKYAFPVEHAIKKLRRQVWDKDAPSFYFIPAKWVRACSTTSLPRMQTLRKDGHLEKRSVPLASAFRGEGIIKHILFVSHRWETPNQPDVNGEQLNAIKKYLEAHPDIEWVWFDYSSMPQKVDGFDDRTVMEKAEFQLMLAAIADLYLTAHVLILLDGSYASRFWTLTEAWCSMQTATPEGLRPATKAERRYTISCIHNATAETTEKGLVDLVSKKAPKEMHGILEKPDVNVTNAKDKATMLPKILKINEHVIETFEKQVKINEHVIETFQKQVILPEPKPAVATAAPNPVPALEQRYAIGSCVFLKRSNGEETLAYVNAYDEEEARYTVEIETLGSGQTEKCHDKDLRAAGVIEGFISSARASLFASKADDGDLHHS